MIMSVNFTVRCTPFCQPCAKGYKHHDLLVALLNLDSSIRDRDREHEYLAKMIKKHETLGWDRNSAILEKNEEFQFPLLHWACVLGKHKTVQWLLQNGFSPTVQCSATKETALHRILVTLPDLGGLKCGRQFVFETMLGLLKDCLVIGDHKQHTPLHVAAKHMLKTSDKLSNMYEKFLHAIIMEVQKMPHEKQRLVLNATNNTGDTALHILAENDKGLDVMQKLLAAGADAMITNKLSISPLDIAVKEGALSIVDLLRKTVLQGCWRASELASGTPGDASPNQEHKKRRSERRSRLLAEFRINDSGGSDFDTSSEGSVDRVTLAQLRDDLQFGNHDEVNDTLVTSSTRTDLVIVKQEPDEDENSQTCHCSQTEKTLIEISDTEDQNAKRTAEEANNSSSLIQMINDAGVFPNLSILIMNTKEQHSNKLENLEKSIKEADVEFEEHEDRQVEIKGEIIRMKKELESKTQVLKQLAEAKERVSQKRKLLQDESNDLRKKMKSCETLLESVSKSVDG